MKRNPFEKLLLVRTGRGQDWHHGHSKERRDLHEDPTPLAVAVVWGVAVWLVIGLVAWAVLA